MDYSQLKKDLEGLYITIPTLFNDPDLTINEKGIRQHVAFLRSNGINNHNAVLLAGGAAGDFSTMSFDERVKVAGIVKDAAGDIPVALGAQTTSTMELKALAKAAELSRHFASLTSLAAVEAHETSEAMTLGFRVAST